MQIELNCQVYYPCTNQEEFLNIQAFLMFRKVIREEFQAIDKFVDYNDTMQIITYTMKRQYQMPLTQYLKLCIKKIIKPPDTEHLIEKLVNAFGDYVNDLIEKKELCIAKIELDKIWVQIDGDHEIFSMHIVNLICKPNQKISPHEIEKDCQEFNQLVQEFYAHNRDGRSSIKKIYQTFSNIIVSKFAVHNQSEQLIDRFYDLVASQDNNLFKNRILNNVVANELYNFIVETQANSDQISKEYEEINNLFQINYSRIFECICSLIDSVKQEASYKFGQEASDLFEKTIFKNDNRDVFIMSLLLKHFSIYDLRDYNMTSQIKDSLLNQLKQEFMITSLKLFKNPLTKHHFITVLSLQKNQIYIENLQNVFEQIYNHLLIATQINLKGFNFDQKYKLFTNLETENQFVSTSIQLITDSGIQPEKITESLILEQWEKSDFFKQRIILFTNILTTLQDTINTSTDELAEQLSYFLIQCLEEKEFDENQLSKEIITRIMHQEITQIIKKFDQI